MAFSHAHVTIAADGTATIPVGSICSSRYLLYVARAIAQLAAFNQTIPAGAEGAATLRRLADVANDDGDWMASVLALVKARVPGTLGGLQKTPNPNNAATLTDPSGADVDLDLV